MSFACVCCGNLTLPQPPPLNRVACPICHWQDDERQDRRPEVPEGANPVSLREAQRNYRRFAAIDESFREIVRPPQPSERPPAF